MREKILSVRQTQSKIKVLLFSRAQPANLGKAQLAIEAFSPRVAMFHTEMNAGRIQTSEVIQQSAEQGCSMSSSLGARQQSQVEMGRKIMKRRGIMDEGMMTLVIEFLGRRPSRGIAGGRRTARAQARQPRLEKKFIELIGLERAHDETADPEVIFQDQRQAGLDSQVGAEADQSEGSWIGVERSGVLTGISGPEANGINGFLIRAKARPDPRRGDRGRGGNGFRGRVAATG